MGSQRLQKEREDEMNTIPVDMIWNVVTIMSSHHVTDEHYNLSTKT